MRESSAIFSPLIHSKIIVERK